jgi:inner membrane protein
MDFTNSYGVRPLLPFNNRWFYGDLAFVADPWIWLILGSAVVWLTSVNAFRSVLWVIIGTGLSLLVAFAFREPAASPLVLQPLPVSDIARAIWFVGLLIIVVGAFLRLGRRGPKLARYSLVVLALYYFGLWTARQSALEQARRTLPLDNVFSVAVWPTPANPLLWQSVAASNDAVYARHISLASNLNVEWQEMPVLDVKFVEALRQSRDGRVFLGFARYTSATVEEREDGYSVALRDLRFPLVLNVRFNADLAVESTDLGWY